MQQPGVPPHRSRYRPPSVLPAKCYPHRFKLRTAPVRVKYAKIFGRSGTPGHKKSVSVFEMDVLNRLERFKLLNEKYQFHRNGSLSSNRSAVTEV